MRSRQSSPVDLIIIQYADSRPWNDIREDTQRTMENRARDKEKYLEKLNHLTKEVIRRGFRELVHLKIEFELRSSHKYFMELNFKPNCKTFKILVDPECFQMSDLAISGCLAHELAHVFQFRRPLSFFVHERINRKLLERSADGLAIDRGFAAELYAFLQFHNTYYQQYQQQDGLTLREIKEHLSKGDKNSDA